MDRHEEPYATPIDIAQAHLMDLAVQEKHGVRYLTYWMNDGVIHCLVEAPSADAAMAVHREAHEGVPTEIIEVTYGSVEEVFGQIREPAPGEAYEWSATRTILISRIADGPRLIQRLGDARALEVFREHERLVRDAVTARGGVQLNREISGGLGCFPSAAGAVRSALALQVSFKSQVAANGWGAIGIRIGLTAGEPVAHHRELFGAAVELASAICDAATAGDVLVSGAVRELCMGKGFVFKEPRHLSVPGLEEPVTVYSAADEPDAPEIVAVAAQPPDHLTGREVEILRLIARGRTNQEIAESLVISLNTVARHVSNIYDKTNVANRAEAASYAHTHKLA
jgi:DNA-binding CsgD family transcriptional regulator